jgi:hypothetical protein
MILPLVVVGGLGVIGALGFAGVRARASRRARKVTGTVVAHRSQTSSSGGRIRAPVVDYEVDGATHRFESGTFSTGCPALGEEVVLLVAKDDPSRAMLESGSGATTAAVVVGLLGALLMFVGIFAKAVPP